MIQINLLPDIKLQYIKSRRTQRTTILIATLVSLSALAIFVLLLLTVKVVQKQSIKNLNNDIGKYSKQLEETPDLNKVLTIQQQLNTLSGLHKSKPAAKRLFNYLIQITPAQATISSVNVDFQTGVATMSGTADKIETINKFVDTLKFTKFKLTPDAMEEKQAFTNVVLSSYGAASDGASYDIAFNLDLALFDANNPDIKLNVPKNFITTRSETERPQDLFKAEEEPALEEEGQQ